MLASNYLPPDVAVVCVVEVMQLSVVNNMGGCVSGCEEKSILLPLPLGRPTSILICISVIIHVHHKYMYVPSLYIIIIGMLSMCGHKTIF